MIMYTSTTAAMLQVLSLLGTVSSYSLTQPHQDRVSTRPWIVPRSPEDALKSSTEQGNQLITWMRDPTKAGGKASSAWTDINEIMAHGWQIEDEERGERSAEQPDYIRSLVTPSRDGVHLVFRHDTAKSKTSTAPDGSGVTANYPPTDALYDNTFWPDKGWIIADSNYSPKARVESSLTPQQRHGQVWDNERDFLPDLKHVSDFWWLGWQNACSVTTSNLAGIRGILQRGIINSETKEVLKHMLQKNGKPLPSWKNKITIGSGDDGFPALVGTPVVRSVVLFVIQHRAQSQLPALEIEKIAVYAEGGRPSMEVWLRRIR